MSEQQIKFMVNRINAKDISLESPESPKILNELKLKPKVGFNLNTSIEKIEENTLMLRSTYQSRLKLKRG